MNEQNKKKLGLIFEKFNADLTELQQTAKQKKDKFLSFIEAFEKLGDDTIIPVMEEIKGLLLQEGHESEIVKEPYMEKTTGGRTPSSVIRMEVYPKGSKEKMGDNHPANVGFIVYKDMTEIHVYENTSVPGYNPSGHAGVKAKKYTPETLTKEAVETEIVNTLSEIIKKPSLLF